MLIIRLTRLGRRNIPTFRVVLTEKQNPVKGKFIEMLGHYNPRLKTRSFKKERILYWLAQGAKCSATVHNLLVQEKIIKGPKIKAWHPKKPSSAKATEGKLSSVPASAEASADKKATEGKKATALLPETPSSSEERRGEGKPSFAKATEGKEKPAKPEQKIKKEEPPKDSSNKEAKSAS